MRRFDFAENIRYNIRIKRGDRFLYIWNHSDWPNFHWKEEKLSKLLADVRHRQGRLIGRMENLGFTLKEEAILETLTEDVVKSSEIENETLDKEQVRSSIARRLGMDIGALLPAERDVEGIVEMMLDATQNYADPLTEERLFDWHAALFPTGRSGMKKINVGAWRDDADGPMQVVSGPIGREKVHYEAPPAEQIPNEIPSFLRWFNDENEIDPVIKAGLAHLWFVTIHPFDDGNGRTARAVADMALARSEQSPQRFYSMSAQIRTDRRDYYDELEKTQKGDTDVTVWLIWFLECLSRAIDQADETLSSILFKAKYWDRFKDNPLNERQIKVLNLLLGNFEGKLTTTKWARLTKCSQDTAYRDILDLIEKKMLVKGAEGGRSTSYEVADS